MNRYIHPLQQPQITHPLPKQQSKVGNGSLFKDVLANVSTTVNLTKHASQRLEERNIHITQEKWQQIASKMTEAKQKGVTDALVVLDQAALVVNTKENTVITALEQSEATERIFTNINGTILL